MHFNLKGMQCAEEKEQDEGGGKLLISNNWSNIENTNNNNCSKMSISKGPVAIPFMEDIQENDFIQDDAPDYQWFAEYGYRDSMNCTSSQILRSSILSSLCSSYTYNDLECYNDMARDLDVNLAQIDMEDFKTEDIHSILHPHISDIRHNGSEFCESELGKSEIQFSPVKEIPLVSFSTDSLDCQDQDIMLTCQANKDNYTIAFEGSTLMATSRESHYQTANNTFSSTYSSSKESNDKTTSEESISKNSEVCGNLIRSESPYTTWRKLKQDSSESIKQNSSEKISSSSVTKLPNNLSKSYAFVKCQSLPNLKNNTKMSTSFHQTMMNSINVDTKKDGYVKVYDISNSKIRRKIHNSVFQNGVNFDLISRFISHKHEKGNSQTELGNEEDKREQEEGKTDLKLSANSLTDSFSSFSSHSGGYERLQVAIKRGNNKSEDENNRRVQHMLADRRSKRLMGNYYFTSSDQISIMDRSIQTSLIQNKVNSEEKKLKEKPRREKSSDDEGGKKPVYVMYPNYTLPDLSFLRDHAAELDLDNVFLWPQQFSLSPMIENRSKTVRQCKKGKTKRPCSCPEFEHIRKINFKHIEDWESIMFLLPREYHELLIKMPEIAELMRKDGGKLMENAGHSLLCTSDIKTRGSSHQRTEKATTGGVSCSSTATQPSSGYRGSSTFLTDSSSSSNQVYKYENNDTSTKPPVPRGILRNPAVQNIKSKSSQNSKRYSMFEMRSEKRATPEKRRSLPSQISLSQQKSLREEDEYYCSEDEGVESASSHCESPGPDAKRLEQLLEGSIHWDQQDITRLRDQVSRCLSQVGRKTVSFADRSGNTPPNSPNGSLSSHKCTNQLKSPWLLDLAISEECESSKQNSSCEHSTDQCTNSFVYKKDMLESVVEAVNRLLVSFDEADDAVVAQVALNTLCPALYAILNHGLKRNIETAFGDINNSVWQIVEASAQHGPMTKALHELVLRLNSEDVLNEGLLKFNAFIFGLLNVQALDTWFSYLRTRESILRKHYTDGGLLLSSAKGISADRHLIDHLINTLKPLADYPFKLDLLFECKQLHQSLMQIARSPESPLERSNSNRTSWMLKKIVRSLQSVASANDTTRAQSNEENRPRSCVDSSSGFNFNDIASTVKKRWSGIQIGSKLASAFDKYVIDDEEEYTDSLEHNRKGYYDQSVMEINDTFSEIENEESITRKNDGKFRRLQKKWKMLAEKEITDNNCQAQNLSPTMICDTSYTISKSRIPRPVTSPVKPSSLNFAVPSSNTKCKKSPSSPSGIPMFITKKPSPTTSVGNNKLTKNVMKQRTSRIDKDYPCNAAPRPGSLPERKQSRLNNDKRQSSLNRASVTSNSSHRYVRSLKHRLASDNGHLTFNEGEKLRVIFDVDDKWILCCRGDQKGLVPRRLVLPLTN